MGPSEISPGPAQKLKQEVLDTGLCTSCGACTGYCPYIKTFGERVAVIHDCKLADGACYRVCPRVYTRYDDLRQAVFGPAAGNDPVLGTHSAIYFARASDKSIRTRGQYGGVVTALAGFAFTRGFTDCTLLTGGGPSGPKPVLATDESGIQACAGSKYTAVPTLTLFHQAVKENYSKIGVVGRACQATAARKLQREQAAGGERLTLVIGLFCFWSLEPEFYSYLRDKQLDGVTRMDIPVGGAVFSSEERQVMVPLDEIRPFIREACQTSCFDPLSELADISVGSTEHDPGWNTLIVRSSAGKRLVEAAAAGGAIELKPYPAGLLPALTSAVLQKKRRVLTGPGAARVGVPEEEKRFLTGQSQPVPGENPPGVEGGVRQ